MNSKENVPLKVFVREQVCKVSFDTNLKLRQLVRGCDQEFNFNVKGPNGNRDSRPVVDPNKPTVTTFHRVCSYMM